MNDLELYYKSDFYKVRSSMMEMIEEKFNEYDFVNTFRRFYKENNLEQFKNYVKEKLNNVSELEKYTLNEMHKMFSESNCGWDMYKIAEIVHKALIELWYPKDFE